MIYTVRLKNGMRGKMTVNDCGGCIKDMIGNLVQIQSIDEPGLLSTGYLSEILDQEDTNNGVNKFVRKIQNMSERKKNETLAKLQN